MNPRFVNAPPCLHVPVFCVFVELSVWLLLLLGTRFQYGTQAALKSTLRLLRAGITGLGHQTQHSLSPRLSLSSLIPPSGFSGLFSSFRSFSFLPRRVLLGPSHSLETQRPWSHTPSPLTLPEEASIGEGRVLPLRLASSGPWGESPSYTKR